MQEEFLHFVWRWRRFQQDSLQTTDGQALEIVHPGEPNADAGPDFFNARIRIGDTLWAGNVEIHERSSEWYAHHHHTDRAYDSVVLHVVFEEDAPVTRADGQRLPCLALRDRLFPRLVDRYWRLMSAREWVPCASRIAEVSSMVKVSWLDRLAIERLQEKTEEVARCVAATQHQWEETFYQRVAYALGLKINAEAFETLARIAPLHLLARHRDHLLQLEALLFGQAGFLGDVPADDYTRALAEEYRFLQHKYQLTPMPAHRWKFFRLRPSGFPTVRIAQLAALLHKVPLPFSAVLEAAEPADIAQLFDIEVSPYWQTHYRFGKASAARRKPIGRDLLQRLLINTVAPFLFYYGCYQNSPPHREAALRLLDALPPEKNAVLDRWAQLGLTPRNAAHAQALLHLKTRYCQTFRCLQCAIGTALLR